MSDALNHVVDQAYAFLKNHQFELAHQLLASVLSEQPEHLIGLRLMAHTLVGLREHEQALKFLEQALRIDSQHLGTWNLSGVVFKHLRQSQRAIECYQYALRLNPDNTDVQFNLALLSIETGDFAVAIDLLRRVCELRANDPDVQYQFAVALEKSGFIDQAIKHFDWAIELGAKQSYLHGHVLHLKSQIYDWSDWDARIGQLRSLLRDGHACAIPFHALTLIDDTALQRRSAEIFLAHQKFPSTSQKLKISTSSNKKIRVAYLSCDFYDHATAHLVLPLFELHDRLKFEVMVYGWGIRREDWMHQKIIKAADQFFDISNLSAAQAVELIRSHEVDVAVDLKGFTWGARPEIFAQRCAPVQISYLGFPATTGMPQMDAVIADRVLIEPQQEADFVERILYMPHTYQINGEWIEPQQHNLSRQMFNLPEHACVMGVFNRGYKVSAQCFSVWMRILNAVPHAVIWWLEDDQQARQRLVEHAAQWGIDSDRIVFTVPLAHDEHLSRMMLADLCLDTFPCTGHTTTSDTLRAGVPMVTLKGLSWMSRVSASLLTALGLPHWIVNNESEYLDWVTQAATHPEWLAQNRANLKQLNQQSPLFDPKRFTQDFEAQIILALDTPRSDAD